MRIFRVLLPLAGGEGGLSNVSLMSRSEKYRSNYAAKCVDGRTDGLSARNTQRDAVDTTGPQAYASAKSKLKRKCGEDQLDVEGP